MKDIKGTALTYLHQMTGNPTAYFHEDQWESIDQLVNKQSQLLVVQRTGWGKSAVYFIATKIRRAQKFGPTLIISPLLSLIRNQIDSAAKLGLKVVSYNSSMDKDERQQAENQILTGRVDAVIVAPEQLGQTYFAEKVLSHISGNIGLFVVDEAHCISDWGHDFRPDYGRIVRVLKNMPKNMPVLATTATANNRVVNDIKDQLGDRLSIIRGSLTRKSLQLQNIDISNKSERLAWLAKYLPDISGTGIIYAKTTKDCEIVAGFLQTQGIDAHPYHSQLATKEIKEGLEQALLRNKIKALVSTSALGMGFDKPDLSFVIHYQSPGNVVEYYQQVGRAGRAIDSAIMMLCKEDGLIQQYFIDNAFPKENQINKLLDVIEQHDGMKVTELEPLVNFAKGTIESILKFLSIEQPSPILKDDKHYFRTQFDYQIPKEKIERLNTVKQNEWEVLNTYHKSTSCLMQFLSKELDDPNSQPCGKCENCKPDDKLAEKIDQSLVLKANDYLRHRYIQIPPRATFASSGANARLAFSNYGLPYSANKANLNIESGMALSSWKDGGWGDIVAEGKFNGSFSHDLIPPMVKMINSMPYEQRPTWLTYIPSPRHPNLVKNFAYALANALGVQCKDTINIAEKRPPQKTMENSFHQSKNLDGAFGIDISQTHTAPVWLLDDAVDSRWTFTIAGALLRKHGIPNVIPIALTSTSKNN
jgi:ATP-dependent DNA helicase RecQ